MRRCLRGDRYVRGGEDEESVVTGVEAESGVDPRPERACRGRWIGSEREVADGDRAGNAEASGVDRAAIQRPSDPGVLRVADVPQRGANRADDGIRRVVGIDDE